MTPQTSDPGGAPMRRALVQPSERGVTRKRATMAATPVPAMASSGPVPSRSRRPLIRPSTVPASGPPKKAG